MARIRLRGLGGALALIVLAGQVTASQSPSLDGIRELLRRGQSGDAERQARALLVRTERETGPDTLEVADILDLLSESLRDRPPAEVIPSLDLVARAITIRETARGLDDPNVARSLTNVAILRALANDPAGARPLLERALAIRQNAYGPDHVLVASSLNNLAGLLMTLRDDAGARVLLERALAIREKAFGQTHVEVASGLFNFGNFLRETNDFSGAQRAFERALAIQELAYGPNHSAVAATLTNLAVILSQTGNYAAAIRMHERVVGIWVANVGPDDRRVAMPLNNLALVLTEAGDYAAARAPAERALAIHEQAYGAWHPEVAKRLHTLGIVLAEQGDYAGARRLFDRAVEIHVRALGPDEPEVAFALTSVGGILRATGDHAGARAAHARALAIREHRLGADDPLVAESLSHVGAELMTAKEFESARTLFQRALEIDERVFGGAHASVATALNNLAEVFAETGADGRARPLYERALTVGEQALGGSHPFLAVVLSNLAALDRRMGNETGAEERLRRALAIQERALGVAHPDIATTLVHLAEVEADAGHTEAAASAALRAETIARDHVQLTLRAMSEREALTYAASRPSGLDVVLSLAAEPRSGTRGVGPRAWDAVIRGRALVLDEMARRSAAIERASDPDVARLNARLSAARQRLGRLTVRGIDQDDPDRQRQLLDQARRDQEQAERDLADRSLAFRARESTGRAGLDQVAAAIPRDAALVAFVRYRQQHAPDSVPSYLAFVLAGDRSQPAVVALGAASAPDDLIAEMRAQIVQEGRAPGRSAVTEAAYRRTGESLRRLVWDPLARHLAGVRRVFIVPDGALHLVNFAALPADRTRYLVEAGPSIHYLSAERDVLMTAADLPATGPMLMVAAPAFQAAPTSPIESSALAASAVSGSGILRGSRPTCTDFRSMQFDPLPASAREADAIIRLWHGAGGQPGADVERLLNSSASELRVKAGANGKRVMHLATHAFFLNTVCEPANPLLLSGLALAGANRRAMARADSDDGILTADEIAALNLTGTEWVVLSGCDTAVGDIRVGEGVLGLRRAFQLAGARTVIMSLWSVEDEAARAWMVQLYRERLTRRRATDEAVTAASRAVLRERRARGQSTHPFFWAAFVAAGDWR